MRRLLAVLLVAAASRLHAAPRSVAVGDYLLTSWRTEDGLPENSINSLAQTTDGYLWLGTRNGLARFDGLRFTTFFPGDTLPTTFSYAKRMSTEGETLWAVGNNGHVLEQTRGRFKTWWHPKGDIEDKASDFLGKIDGVECVVFKSGAILRLPTDGPATLTSWTNLQTAVRTSQHAHDGTGAFWFVTRDQKVARLHSGQPDYLPADCGLGGRGVRTICSNAQGEICAGTDREVAVFREGRFHTLLTVTNVTNLLPARREGLWVWGDQKLCRWHTNGMYTTMPWPEGTQVWGAEEDDDGNLWCGTFGTGLWRITPVGELLRLTTKEGLPGNLVIALIRDQDGNIWAGMDGGLTRVRRRLFEISEGAGGNGERIMTTVCSDHNGGMWAGTYGQGLYHRENGVWSIHPVPGFPTNMFVYAVLTDTRKRTWVSTRGGGGLIRFQGNETSRPFQGAPSETSIKALWEDSKQRLWFGSDEGCGVLETNASSPTEISSTTDVRAFAETRDGAIWIGSDGDGLLRWEEGKLESFHRTNGLPGESIWALLPAEDGGLWIGTPHNGLVHWRDGKGVTITAEDGLPDNTVCQLMEDRTGHIWGSTFHGIFRVAKSALMARIRSGSGRLPCTTFGRGDGLLAEQCRGGMQPAGMVSEDGRLWFPTMEGLASIESDRLDRPVSPLRSVITGFTVDGKNLADGNSAPAGSSRFAFAYTAPSLTAAEKVLFRYRLVGLDKDWTEIGTRRDVLFDTLQPGDYRFEVSACHPGGGWDGPTAALAFSVTPFLWQRSGFQWAMFLLIGMAMVLGVRWFSQRGIRRQLARAKMVAAIELERTRISRDMHDELGSRLTKLSILGELAGRNLDTAATARSHLQNLSEVARQTSESLSELIWTVKPANDTLDNLANRLRQCADEFFRDSDIRCRFEIPNDLPVLPATSEVRQQILLAVKEALNNIAKHAQATELHLAVEAEPGGFTVVVSDNGRGLKNGGERLSPASGGNGIPNMQRRMERIGGRCTVETAATGGVIVRLRVPLRERP